ncbi:MAG: TadE/TadG family type IV pilus assembly protein [Pseudomonadota bacterium]
MMGYGFDGPLLRNLDARASEAKRGLRRFAREERGSLTIFAVYMFVLMLFVGGIGIDLMRFERDRTHLQSTLDRAVLAAADLDQTLDPQTVVNDYFSKAGLGEYLASVTVSSGLGFRTVSATAEGQFDTQFMHMGGVDTLATPAAGAAEERIDGVEISLVLDVSGSMNDNSRLTNLKIAAKKFVTEMISNSQDGKLSISIIPYATQVSIPSEMAAEFNITDEHDYSTCVNFEADDFTETSMSTSDELQRTMHFDPWYNWDGRDNDPVELIGLDNGLDSSLPVCEAMANREIMPLSKSENDLNTYIESFVARGNTSLDVGMKWGVALLDPSLRTVVSSLNQAGVVHDDFKNRPNNYNDGETIKVVVLMTDGENTSQYYINDEFRDGDSNIWWNEQEEQYSVYVGLDVDDEDGDGIYDEPLFYWTFDGNWHDHAYGEGTYDKTTYDYECTSYYWNGSCRNYQTIATTVTIDEPGTAEIVEYPDLWAYTTLQRIVTKLYTPWMIDNNAWDDWYYGVRNYVGWSTKDARTRTMCNTAKEKQVIVYTIAFEAPSGGEAVLRDCASSPNHFFDVEGLEISDAFASIASSIRKLRLTQ